MNAVESMASPKGPAAAAKGFVMPAIEINVPVLWYPDGNRETEPHPGIVTRIGRNNVAINVMDQNSHNFNLKDGVRHIEDPRAQIAELHELGAWDYCPWYKALLTLIEKSAWKEKKAQEAK